MLYIKHYTLHFIHYTFLGVLMLLVSCGPEKFVKKGDEAMYIGEYYNASLQYAKAYSKVNAKDKEKRGVVAYKVAESNRLCNYSAKALAAYRNAVRYKYTDTLTYYYLAVMEMENKDYKNATLHFEEYLKQHPDDRMAKIGLESCKIAPEMKAQGSYYTVREDKVFNGRYIDYSPMLNGDQLFFSSSRKDCEGDEESGITGMLYGDIFFSAKDEKGKWKKVEPLGKGVNTAYDEGTCCFSPSGDAMYFTRCSWDASYPRMAEIYKSSRSDATWGEGKKCEISHDSLTSFAHPAISPDGRYMYFVSNMPGGFGGLDIWRAEMQGEGFGLMENLGPEINTSGDEMFPTFRPNGELYFSTNGRVGMGGLDIFKAKPDTADNHFWRVEHLPSPVNSNGDDFGMTFEGVHNRGYFASNRSNRRGWDKIFTFECPEVIQSVKGWVYEQDGYELPKAQVYIVGDDGTNEKISVQLDGSFNYEVKPNVNYLFMAFCEGYMNYKQELSIPVLEESHEDTLQFPLPSLKLPVLVHNVFYETDKANITKASEPALNALAGLLKQNPSVAIELSAHCDYRGSVTYNEWLSQKRAEAVVKYLISQGVPKDRVVAKGYGKSKPKKITAKFAQMYPFLKEGDELTEDFITKLNKSQQDTCNSLNRRTEFSVIRQTDGILDKKTDDTTGSTAGKSEKVEKTEKVENSTGAAKGEMKKENNVAKDSVNTSPTQQKSLTGIRSIKARAAEAKAKDAEEKAKEATMSKEELLKERMEKFRAAREAEKKNNNVSTELPKGVSTGITTGSDDKKIKNENIKTDGRK